jgi:hypothetical protein
LTELVNRLGLRSGIVVVALLASTEVTGAAHEARPPPVRALNCPSVDPGVSADLHSIAESTRVLASTATSANLLLRPSFTWDKALAPVISTVALLLSLATLFYTRKKDSRARAQSILDDYWLRKIASPLVIEPLLKWILEGVIATIPDDCGSPDFSAELVSNYAAPHQKEKITHVHSIIALSPLDSGLYDRVLASIDAIEDAVISYCAQNRNSVVDKNGAPACPKGALIAELKVELGHILRSVLDFQVNLSDAATRPPSIFGRFATRFKSMLGRK